MSLTLVTATPGTALDRAQEARPYELSYLMLREFANSHAHELSIDGWMLVRRAQDYCGWRYNDTLFNGTPMEPPPWRSR